MKIRILAAGITMIAALGCVRAPGQTMNQNDEIQAAWRLRLETSGGITGRGLGSVTVDSSGAVSGQGLSGPCSGSADVRDLSARVASAEPGRWKPSWATAKNPRGYADQISYHLTLERGGTFSTQWYDENFPSLPEDLAALYSAAWKVRESACR